MAVQPLAQFGTSTFPLTPGTTNLISAQELPTPPLVELYELDTSGLTSLNGVSNAGQVYCFTPGALPQRPLVTVLISAANPLEWFVSGVELTLSPPSGYTITILQGPGVESAAGFTTTIVSAFYAGANTVITVANNAGLTAYNTPQFSAILAGPGIVSFAGVTYNPFPIQVTGYQKNSQGKLARPSLKVDNTVLLAGTGIPLFAALVIAFGDALGAKVTRYQVFADNLDYAYNADSTAVFEPEIYYINRKVSHNKTYIEFELTSNFDQVGLRLPRRQILRDTCTRTYRRWDTTQGAFVYGNCPYNGGPYYDYTDTAQGDPTQDICGKRFSSCQLRYGAAPLPLWSFPGVGLVDQ